MNSLFADFYGATSIVSFSLTILLFIVTAISNYLGSQEHIVDILILPGREPKGISKDKPVVYIYLQNQRNQPIDGKLTIHVDVDAIGDMQYIEKIELFAGPEQYQFKIIEPKTSSFKVESSAGMRAMATWSLRILLKNNVGLHCSLKTTSNKLLSDVKATSSVSNSSVSSLNNRRKSAIKLLWAALVAAIGSHVLFAQFILDDASIATIKFAERQWPALLIVIAGTLIYYMAVLMLTKPKIHPIVQGYSKVTTEWPHESKQNLLDKNEENFNSSRWGGRR